MSVVSTANIMPGLIVYLTKTKRELTQLDLGPTDAGLVCSQIARGNNVLL